MIRNETTLQQAKFVAEYAAHLMGCGIHTSGVIRNAKRIGEAFDLDVMISGFQKTIILTILEKKTEHTLSEVIEIPALPISFKHNAELSALSWEAVDKPLTFDEIKEKYYRIIQEPRMNMVLLLILVGLANASFCRLFKGDWLSMTIVFVATVVGFYVRTLLQKKQINHYIVFIVSALVASMMSSFSLLFNTTSDIAIATSVLYLIPGVPLVNGVLDVVEGHTLTGISRLVNAFLLIVCIAIGLSITLFIVNNHLI